MGCLSSNARAAIEQIRSACEKINSLPSDEKIDAINQAKLLLHKISPFINEPVDCVLWVPNASVRANDYNPNRVAPPEMELLKESIELDGYTQPIVTWLSADKREVVDGFHRNLVGRDNDVIRRRLLGRLPVTTINQDRIGRSDRIAATIRHNRARGKHQIQAMSEIVVELSKRNWNDEKIAKELGMDADEVLRLKQISGLAELFGDRDFSEAWEVK